VLFSATEDASLVLRIDDKMVTVNNSIILTYGELIIFAIIDSNTVQIYYQTLENIKKKTEFQSKIIDYKDFGLPVESELDFKLIAISTNPQDPSQFFLVSTTSLNDDLITNRISTVIVTDLLSSQKITIDSTYKTFNAPKIQGEIKICSLGKEHIISTQADSVIKSISATGSGVQKIDYSTYGLDATKSELICVPGRSEFVIVDRTVPDKQKYLVLFGNKVGNIQDRYHSLEDLSQGDFTGYQLISVSAGKYGLNIVLEKQVLDKIDRVMKALFTDGPFAIYRGDTTVAMP
jgi:hypothetical protein